MTIQIYIMNYVKTTNLHIVLCKLTLFKDYGDMSAEKWAIIGDVLKWVGKFIVAPVAVTLIADAIKGKKPFFYIKKLFGWLKSNKAKAQTISKEGYLIQIPDKKESISIKLSNGSKISFSVASIKETYSSKNEFVNEYLNIHQKFMTDNDITSKEMNDALAWVWDQCRKV